MADTNFLVLFDTMFSGSTGAVMQYGLLFLVACACIGLCWKMYKEQSKYKTFVDVYQTVGSSFKLLKTKAAMIQNKKDKTYRFTSRKFGDDDQIDIRPPDKSYYSDYEKHLWNINFFPKVQAEQIAFLNPRKGVYVPIRKSFINIKRGQDLTVTRKEDCKFCEHKLDMNEYVNEEQYRVAAHNTYPDLDTSQCCEKHFNELVNARFEALDPADISWMWKQQEELRAKYVKASLLQQPVVLAAVSFIFVLGVIIFTYKMQPDMYQIAIETYAKVAKETATQVVQAKYNGTLPTN